MVISPILIFHISAGCLALLSGAGALVFRKGDLPHRASGNIFVVSMLSMSASAAYLAFMKSERINVVVGILTFYLVATAWVTIKRKVKETGLFEYGACLVALAVGVYGITLAFEALNSESGYLDGEMIPVGAYFFFASMAILAALLDVTMFIRKGVSGKQRIARHLWRMCFALLIAAASFFLGQAQVFPAALQDSILLVVPVLIVLIALIFWLIRVSFTGWWKEDVSA